MIRVFFGGVFWHDAFKQSNKQIHGDDCCPGKCRNDMILLVYLCLICLSIREITWHTACGFHVAFMRMLNFIYAHYVDHVTMMVLFVHGPNLALGW